MSEIPVISMRDAKKLYRHDKAAAAVGVGTMPKSLRKLVREKYGALPANRCTPKLFKILSGGTW